MFSPFTNTDSLSRLLLPSEQWRPHPPASDHAAWNALPEAVRKNCVTVAETMLTKPWPELPATLYLQYARDGNRSNFEGPHCGRRAQVLALAIGECVEGRGRFVDRLADGIWLLCEESSWCLPAHVEAQKAGSGLPDITEPVLDLFAGETGALLAWIHYLLEPALAGVSPLLPERIEREVALRILAPARNREDWWWQGFGGQAVNNWNPWINSNVLTCVLLLERDQAARAALVAKTLRSLDCFITPYPSDGGCDEGPGYWSGAAASVFDCLDLMDSATGGKLTFWDQPLIMEMGRFIYRAHLADSWYINFADAPARLTPDAALVYCYGERIHDADMMAFGAWLRLYPAQHSTASSTGRRLRALFCGDRLADSPARAPLLRDSWLPVLQVLVTRSQAGSSAGLTLAAKGGHNGESHNHNDVGSFIVYAGGRPLLIDVGVETYRRETFGKDRYAIWTMQSQFHNLPTINGAQQLPGDDYNATSVSCRHDDHQATLELDIAPAYAPEAQLKSWMRRLHLQRGGPVTITDRYQCNAPPQALFLSLMTPCKPHINHGVIELAERPLPSNQRSGTGRIIFDANALQPVVENIELVDGNLRGIWGERLYRIVLRAVNPGANGEFTLQIV